MICKKNRLIGLMLVGSLLFASACISHSPPGLDGPVGYHDLMVRARRLEAGRFKGGRVIVKSQVERGVVLFLSPVNQVILKMEVKDEEALLLNPRRKRFWRGEVRGLLRSLWNLPLSWSELRRLLIDGEAPSLESDLGRWRITRGEGLNWSEAELDGGHGRWRFSVLKRAYTRQTLPGVQDLRDWVEGGLEEVLGEDETD